MLRRYNSQNLETIPMQSKVLTIGTTGKCDIKLKDKGVHPVHASIEQNPSSGTFWLKDHSLAGRTTVNGRSVHGEVELKNGDFVRIGRAQPFVFEKRSFTPFHGDNVFEDPPRKDNSKPAMFPVLGVKKQLSVKPSKNGVDRPMTALVRGRRTAASRAGKKPEQDSEEIRHFSPSSSIETNSITSLSTVSSGSRLASNARGSVGNHLLQRVVRLQDELTRKNLEIDQLRRQKSYPDTGDPLSKSYPYYLPFLHDPTIAGSEPNARNFELETYRAFLGTVAAKIRSFNEYILQGRQSDFSDVFLAFINLTKEPISQKMIEIERECDIELEKKGFTALQRSHLPDLFRNDRKANILKVAGEIERLVPVIREACATAGESIRVCSVFTHWCQQLGDQIRIEGLTGTQLMNAVEELKEDFYRNRMEGHWLLPSISPLLSLTAHELEKSRENSLIAETQTGESSMSSVGDKNIFKAAAELSGENSSRLLNNEQLEKEDKNDKCGPSVEKHDDECEKTVDRLLEEAEKKSAQLENQLNALQRKISESKNVDESTHIRLYQLLHRLNTSASSILIVDGGDAVEEPVHKQSAASVMSLNITADDIHHGRRVFAGEEAVAPSSKQENLPDESTLTGQQNVPRLQLNGNREASRDDADNDSHYSYENDFDDELYQFYCDSSRHLGWPTKLLVQFSQTCAVVVNGELLSDVIKCSRTLLNEHMNGVPEESKSSGKGGNRYTKEAGVNESEAHSQLMGMIQSTIDDEGTPDMENKKQDKAEIGKKPNFEEYGDDIEDKIEVRHTNAQEGANIGRSPTPDKAGTESIENSDAQQNQTSAGVDDPQNGIGAHPESPSGSDQPSSHVSAVASARDTEETGGGVDENENENSGRTFSPTTPTAEDGRQNDEAETKSGEETPSSSTPITENGDQNLDGAEMKSSRETPSPSTPIAEEGGHQMDGTGARKGEVNLSLNNPIAKEEDEAEMKSDEGTPLSSSRTTERGDQRQDGAELKCEKRIPSLSTPTVEFANQNSDEGEIKSDEGRTPSSSTPTPDEGDQMEHRDESKEKDGQAISLRAPTGEEDEQNLDGAEIEESNDSTPSTGTPSFSETNHKVDRAQTKSVEDDPSHSKPPMPIVMNGDLPSRSESATTASSDIQYPSKASFPRTAQEYELSHKYHIQSHVNTATRTPVIVQAVPLQRNLFRSPTTIRKFASEDIAEKPVLLQPRFVH